MSARRSVWSLVLAVASAAGCRDTHSEALALKARADSLKSTGAYDAALVQYDRALALDSTDGRLLNNRGATYMERGEHDRAIADFDRAIRLNPNHGQALKNRSRALFYLGRYADATRDMQKALPFDSTNAYVVIWLHIARRRLGEDDAPAFASQLAKTDTTRWPAAVGKFYLGTLTRDALLAAAALVDPRVKRDQRCAAAFFLGQDAMIRNRPADATRYFEETRSNCPKDWTEYQSAVAELGRLAGTTAPTR